MLSGQYLAKSEFGSYFEKATVDIEGTPYGITQLYEYSAKISTDLGEAENNFQTVTDGLGKDITAVGKEIDSVSQSFEDYKVYTRHFIKEGYLDTTTSNPVFGIDIGLLESTFTVDGKIISNSVPKKIRITPDKMSFYSGSYEVAYIKETAIYFPNANITGGMLNIGNDTFTVDNEGNMKATSGTIAGWSIKDGRLEKDNTGSGGYRVGIQSSAAKTTSAAFFAGCNTESGGSIANATSSAFYVTHAGHLYAQSANITGAITATSLTLGNGVKVPYSSVSGTPNLNVYVKKDGTIGTVGSGSTGIKISSAGLLQASNAVIYGTIYASEGTIAGWSITGSRIEKDNTENNGYRVGIQSNAEKTSSAAFFAGCNTASGGSIANSSNSAFYVTHAGHLYAQSADIAGKITAKSGSIGGFEIADSSTNPSNGFWKNSLSTVTNNNNEYYAAFIRAAGGYDNVAFGVKTITKSRKPTQADWSSDDSKYNFYVKCDGKLYAKNADIEGKITASEGTIGNFTIKNSYLCTANKSWGTDDSLTLCPGGSTGSRDIAGSGSITGWTIISGLNFGVTKAGDLYAKGANIAGKITATSGTLKGMDIIGYLDIGNSTLNAGNGNGLGIRGYFGKGATGSDRIILRVVKETVKNGNEETDVYHTAVGADAYTTVIYGPCITNTSLDVTDNLTVFGNVEYYGTHKSQSSDVRLKRNICKFNEKHEKFFEMLKPRSYIMKNDAEGQTQFGFIAQNVQYALNKSGFNSEDIALVRKMKKLSEKEDYLGLSYIDFISLNTHMIQKCLKEIAALKAEINLLKAERT
ncbi:MAG: tail fiber domain-containing protein, partial [Ruminococcus sp.]|nr:tail fiber domain-containing protein [Ruminococcus sp.]